ncbi:MAG: hypothetical protein M5U18_05065 [Dehalococcoidia bacterium]|nr:hypothetical protein [Dehalococcoidia bacterium]
MQNANGVFAQSWRWAGQPLAPAIKVPGGAFVGEGPNTWRIYIDEEPKVVQLWVSQKVWSGLNGGGSDPGHLQRCGKL